MFCIRSSQSTFLPQTANVVRPTEKKILKGKMTEFVPPQIRTVLKTYQNSATKSLHGPGQSLVSHHNTSSSNSSSSSSGNSNSNNNNIIGIDNNNSSSNNKNISIINNSHGINSSLGLSNNKTINNGYLSNENNAASREIGSNIGINMNKNNNSNNNTNNNSNNDGSSTITNNINSSKSSNNNNGAPLNFCSGGTIGIIKKELHSPTNSSDASSLDLNDCSGTENQTNSININSSSSTTLSSSSSSFSSLSSTTSSSGTELITTGLIVRPPSLPEIPQPILTAPDPGTGELYETILEGKSIGCFLLGGEMRLCLPQFLNNVLTDFTLDQINRIFDDLRIFCSQCTPEQLMEFKAAKILPDDVKASGLITRTDAERLCSALLHRSDRVNVDIPKSAFSFKVYHRCFGKCEGLFTPDLYSYEKPACIMCLECKGMFSPQKFVGHVHRQKENRTCHWGFDSRNWREYLLVGLDVENREKCSKILDEIRDIEQQEMLNAQQRDISYLKRKVDLIDDPLLETQLPLCKQGALDIPSKRAKIIDEPSYLLEYQRYQQALYYAHVRREQLSAFRPWAPKPMLHLPYNTVTAAVAANAVASAAAAAASLPYFSQEPPILQNPERVVRHTDTELFERTFQPNVALAPRKNILTKEREREKEREKEIEHRDDREREQYHYDKQHQQQYHHNHLQHRNNNHQNQFGNLSNDNTEVYIKQERPSTPDVFTQPFPEKVRITSPTANLSNNLSQLQEQRHQNRRNNHHHAHQHQLSTTHSQYATRISSNHVTQDSNFPHFHHHSQQDQQPSQKHYQHQSVRHNIPTTTAAISPEERSGSNEITSSTSPVTLNNCGANNNNNNNGKMTPEQNLIQHQHQATTITAIKLQKTANNSMIANIPNHAHHINSNINCNNINKDKMNSDNLRSITAAPILHEQYLINSSSYKSNIKAIHTHHPQQTSPQSSPSLSSNTVPLGLDSNINAADGIFIKNITTNGGLHEYSIGTNKNSEVTILQSNSGRPFIGNSEFELSTDTDDDSLAGEPDSSNMTAAWDLATDALRDVQPNDRDKVLYVVKMLVHENTQLRLEKSHLLQELRYKDEQIAELRRELRYCQRQSASPSPQMSPVLANNISTFTSIKQKMISSCTTSNNINYNHSASKNNNDHSNNNNSNNNNNINNNNINSNNNANINNNNNNNKVSSNSNVGVIAKVESCLSVAGSTTSPMKQNQQQQQYHVVHHKSESEKIKVPPKKSARHSPEDTVVVLNHQSNVLKDEIVTGASKSSITETNSTSLPSSTLSFSSSSPSTSSSLSHNSPLSFSGATNNSNNIEKNDSNSVISNNNNNNNNNNNISNNNNNNNNNVNNNSNCSSKNSLNTTKLISESEDDGVAATSSTSTASLSSSTSDSIKYERKLPKYQ